MNERFDNVETALKTLRMTLKRSLKTLSMNATQKGIKKSVVSQLKTDMTEVKEDVSTIASELEIEIGKNKKTA